MESPVASEGIHLSAFRTPLPLSPTNGKPAAGGFNDAGYYHRYDDGTSVEPRGSDGLTGYETLDTAPHYDFYANTGVWGRPRRFRPSLFQLHANPEVRTA